MSSLNFTLPLELATHIQYGPCPTCGAPFIAYRGSKGKVLSIEERRRMEKAALLVAKQLYIGKQWWIDYDRHIDQPDVTWHIREGTRS